MKIIQEFKEFAMRGNVLDLAVGVIVGAAFGKIVASLVEDIIMPPIGYIMKGVNFSDLYWSLDGFHYNSIAEAKEKGAPIIAYGPFLNVLINFLIVAFCVFLLVKGINTLKRKKPEAPKAATEKDCPYCLQKVPVLATRCAHCTSQLHVAGEGQTQ